MEILINILFARCLIKRIRQEYFIRRFTGNTDSEAFGQNMEYDMVKVVQL